MNLRVAQGTHRGERCVFVFEGAQIEAYQGETVAAALLAHGERKFREDNLHQGRGPYCNMGTCFECVVEVRVPGDVTARDTPRGAWRLVRACLARVSPGLEVRSIKSLAGAQSLSGDRREQH
jgi:hypothetical protein